MFSHFNFQYIKDNKVMFGVIALVFGVGVWLLLEKSGGSSGSSDSSGATTGTTSVIQSGPSDAQVAAATALQQTQIAGQTQVSLAQIAAGAQAEQDQASLAATQIGANSTDKANDLAAQVALTTAATNASEATAQLQAQSAMFHDQLQQQIDLNASNNATTIGIANISATTTEALSHDQLAAFTAQLNQQTESQYISTLGTLGSEAASAKKEKQTRGILTIAQQLGQSFTIQ